MYIIVKKNFSLKRIWFKGNKKKFIDHFGNLLYHIVLYASSSDSSSIRNSFPKKHVPSFVERVNMGYVNITYHIFHLIGYTGLPTKDATSATT